MTRKKTDFRDELKKRARIRQLLAELKIEETKPDYPESDRVQDLLKAYWILVPQDRALPLWLLREMMDVKEI